MQTLYNQRGSAAAIGIIAMLFMTIVIGGLLPMVSAEVRSTRTNQDVVEAQYVAEAGAKRALVGFSQSRTDWAWANGTNRNNFQDGTAKAYTVTITPAVVDGAVPASGHYTITSTGFVGDVRKTVSIGIDMTAGSSGNDNASGDVFSKYVIYDKGDFSIDGGPYPKIIGDMGLAGNVVYINNNVNQFFNGKVYATKVPTGYRGWQNDWLVTNGLFVKVNNPEEIGTLTINMPNMPVMPSIPSTVSSGASMVSEPGIIEGAEYYNTTLSSFGGKLEATSSSTAIYATKGIYLTKKGPYDCGAITGAGDLTLYVNGNINLSNGSYIEANGNITIYATGKIDLSNASRIKSNKSIIIIANKGINLTDSGNNIQAPPSGKTSIYSLEDSISLSNNCFINGGMLTLQAKNNVNFANQSYINKDDAYSESIANIFANGSTFTNFVTIGGKAALVITTDRYNLNSNVNAPKTVFVSASGQSEISNSPKIAGIYTNGSLTVSNTPTITYDKDVMEALGLSGGGGGKAKVDLGKWSK